MIRNRLVVACVAALALGTVACSSSSSSSTSAGGTTTSSSSEGGATVSATEKDFAITLDPTEASAGEVTFDISNEGPSAHEFLVVASDEAPDSFQAEDGVVPEDSLDVVDEAEDIAPSTTTDLTVDLEAGSYVIMCNLPGHYEAGMHAGFTVS